MTPKYMTQKSYVHKLWDSKKVVQQCHMIFTRPCIVSHKADNMKQTKNPKKHWSRNSLKVEISAINQLSCCTPWWPSSALGHNSTGVCLCMLVVPDDTYVVVLLCHFNNQEWIHGNVMVVSPANEHMFIHINLTQWNSMWLHQCDSKFPGSMQLQGEIQLLQCSYHNIRNHQY